MHQNSFVNLNFCIHHNRSGECSRTCGGGIQWYIRECNSPIPKNGRYCVGKHRIYKSCNTQDCPIGTLDIREEQCNAMSDHSHSWSAAYNVYSNDQCKLACKNMQTNEFSWLKDKARESNTF